ESRELEICILGSMRGEAGMPSGVSPRLLYPASFVR
ncbi:MAG: hypothetical protein ACI8T1_004962, partial [Verrucomicrobiales bacterium]